MDFSAKERQLRALEHDRKGSIAATVRLDERTIAQLNTITDKENVTRADVMRQAIHEFLEENPHIQNEEDQ